MVRPIVGKTANPFLNFKTRVNHSFTGKKHPQAEDTVQLSTQGNQKKESLVRRILKRLNFSSKPASSALTVKRLEPLPMMTPQPVAKRSSIVAFLPIKKPAKPYPKQDDLNKV